METLIELDGILPPFCHRFATHARDIEKIKMIRKNTKSEQISLGYCIFRHN
jgi:hypothetical protein